MKESSTMAEIKSERQRLHRLLKVEAFLQDLQPEKKAESLINIAFELQIACMQRYSGNSGMQRDLKTRRTQKEYEDVVDCLDMNVGLNNYSEGALSVRRKNRNESEKWVSSLSKELISNLDCVNIFLARCQADAQKITASNLSSPLWPSLIASTSTSVNGTNSDKPLFKQAQPGPPAFPAALNPPNQADVINNGREPSFPWKACGQPNYNVEFGQRLATYQHPAPVFSAFGQSGKRQFEYDDGDEQNGAENAASDFARPVSTNAFKTAKEQLVIQQNKYGGGGEGNSTASNYSYGASRKSLGTRRGMNNRFVPPVLNRDDTDSVSSCGQSWSSSSITVSEKSNQLVDQRLKGLEPKIVELITNEIMDHRPQMDWDDIAGLQFAKKSIKEIVVWPMLRPDIFTGLRGPPKGLLLFGPPGTGKTLIGKCIASQSKSTFFCISASSLTSKWVGEGEKMVKALFAVARCHQPAVIFIDEVDSLLSQRSDAEHEASRRIKTEFLVQLDGATTDSQDHILVIGATNRPQEIDDAARRRFVKRLYIPLPEQLAREHIVRRLMSQQKCHMTDDDITAVANKTQGYSGADMANLCREAALGPIRSIPFEQMEYIHPKQVPPITMKDFEDALPQVRPSVSAKDLDVYITWNNTYGSFGQG